MYATIREGAYMDEDTEAKSFDKIDIETLIGLVQVWQNLGYTDDETERFYDAVVNSLSHLIKR